MIHSSKIESTMAALRELVENTESEAYGAVGEAYNRGFEHGLKVARLVDPERDVFIIPAHSTLGDWNVESCAWSESGVYFYLNQSGKRRSGSEHVGVFQTYEEAVALAEENGFRVSELEPHHPYMRRQHIRPPYAW